MLSLYPLQIQAFPPLPPLSLLFPPDVLPVPFCFPSPAFTQTMFLFTSVALVFISMESRPSRVLRSPFSNPLKDAETTRTIFFSKKEKKIARKVKRLVRVEREQERVKCPPSGSYSLFIRALISTIAN